MRSCGKRSRVFSATENKLSEKYILLLENQQFRINAVRRRFLIFGSNAPADCSDLLL